MASTETLIREEICITGKSLYERRYTVGSAGNISARLDDGWLITPTDACLGRLDPNDIAKVDFDGNHVSGGRPSKTLALHRRIYENNGQTRGVVHTHSTHLVALTLAGVWRAGDVLPPITPYYVMKVGHVPLIPYRRPGDPAVAEEVAALASTVRAVLLERLGPVVGEVGLARVVCARRTGRNRATLSFDDAAPRAFARRRHRRIAHAVRRTLVAAGPQRQHAQGELAMPRFAANLTMMYTEHAFLDRFAAAAKDGFEAVEFLFPYDFPAADIKARLADNGLTQALFNAPPGDWAAGERGIASLPGREDEFRQSVDKALEYTALLGNKKLHVMAGLIAPDQPREAHRAVYLKNVEYAAKAAQSAGVGIVLEPINTRDIPGFFLNRQDEAQAICDEIGAPNLQVQFDIYHCQIVEGDIAVKLKRDMKRPNAGIGHIKLRACRIATSRISANSTIRISSI